MANNTLLASDNFSSGSIAAGWSTIPTASTPVAVTSSPHYAEASVLNANCGIYWSGSTWPSDQTSEVTIQTISTGSIVALIVRQSRIAYTNYMCEIKSGTASAIYITVAGVQTQLLSLGILIVSVGDVFSLQVAGSVLTVYQNGKPVGHVADATITSGFPGVLFYSGTSISNGQISAWRGYYAVQTDGLTWTSSRFLSQLSTQLNILDQF